METKNIRELEIFIKIAYYKKQCFYVIAGSSNGRIHGSGPWHLGSSPSPAASENNIIIPQIQYLRHRISPTITLAKKSKKIFTLRLQWYTCGMNI